MRWRKQHIRPPISPNYKSGQVLTFATSAEPPGGFIELTPIVAPPLGLQTEELVTAKSARADRMPAEAAEGRVPNSTFRMAMATDDDRGYCKSCRWWQAEQDDAEAAMGLCTHPELTHFSIQVAADSGCNRFEHVHMEAGELVGAIK